TPHPTASCCGARHDTKLSVYEVPHEPRHSETLREAHRRATRRIDPEHRNNPNHSARSSDNIGRRRNPLPTAGPADQYGENMPELDPHTPVLVGVGQSSERLDDPEYRGHSAVELATNAAHRAITDSGATGIATELDTIAGIR